MSALSPRLLAIPDLGVAPRERWLSRLAALASALPFGTLAVVLREHELGASERLDFGRALRELTAQGSHELWVADRLDLALLLNADALHLGERSVPASVARRRWRRPISRAWHAAHSTPENADELAGVDALLVSPILAPRKGREAWGTVELGRFALELGAPRLGAPRLGAPALYALGGVTAASASACFAAGAQGVAAIGSILTDDAASWASALSARR